MGASLFGPGSHWVRVLGRPIYILSPSIARAGMGRYRLSESGEASAPHFNTNAGRFWTLELDLGGPSPWDTN
ncbi:hypothetical protein C8Q80DRAFT_1203239 [Daedaleopsis nitida]|nr:hypothetical protein C8Q80DRAFT_1203239 [Daedaleopsis nitida]